MYSGLQYITRVACIQVLGMPNNCVKIDSVGAVRLISQTHKNVFVAISNGVTMGL